MSAEELTTQINSAVEQAIVGEASLDEIDQALADARERIEEVRAFRGETA
ncbi:hypothetical protein SAMN05216388_1017126 [Halorientalis persicus]|uniref:Uncharacterized protein n=1 Tax=Halorientalis persicus TaxID=1367881 RepID=A0A1H8S301_9EURY|nr:hypothetical protein [Halorientalis persicus]SEO72916.1 hypothetical protein SAMN05216388_1017126 [Halorientalis persicus]